MGQLGLRSVHVLYSTVWIIQTGSGTVAGTRGLAVRAGGREAAVQHSPAQSSTVLSTVHRAVEPAIRHSRAGAAYRDAPTRVHARVCWLCCGRLPYCRSYSVRTPDTARGPVEPATAVQALRIGTLLLRYRLLDRCLVGSGGSLGVWAAAVTRQTVGWRWCFGRGAPGSWLALVKTTRRLCRTVCGQPPVQITAAGKTRRRRCRARRRSNGACSVPCKSLPPSHTYHRREPSRASQYSRAVTPTGASGWQRCVIDWPSASQQRSTSQSRANSAAPAPIGATAHTSLLFAWSTLTYKSTSRRAVPLQQSCYSSK